MILGKFKHYLLESGKSENTIKTYSIQIRSYFKYLQIEDDEFAKLNREQIKDYISFLNTVKFRNPKTINNKLSSLLEFNKFLIKEGIQEELMITKNDFIKIHIEYASPSILGEKDVEDFRNRILNRKNQREGKHRVSEKFFKFQVKRDYCIITILAYAGLRISECLNLVLSDMVVLKDGKYIVVDEIIVRSGKGNKARNFAMHYKIKNAIEEYLKVRETDSPYLFYSRESEKLDRTTVNKVFIDYGNGIYPHLLRHFMISNMINKGCFSIPEALSISGHSDPKTLMIYTHPDKKAMKDKMNKL